jgi:chromosome segregation ATPase
MQNASMRSKIMLLPILLLAACVSEDEVRAQVGQSADLLRGEITKSSAESSARIDEVARNLAAARKDVDVRLAAAATDLTTLRSGLEARLQAIDKQLKSVDQDLVSMRAEVQRLSGDLGRSVQELQRRIEASSGALRDHLQRQRSALTEQLKSLDHIIGGLEKPAGSTEPSPVPTPSVR